MSNLKKHAVMMLVSRRAKPGYEAELERVMQQFSDAAANFPGCLGAQLVHPGEEAGAEDSLYHAVLAFENQDCLRAWQHSPQRSLLLASAPASIEGPVVVREVSGLGHWFQTSTGATQAPPPRWKVAVVTWLGICPTVYLLFLLLGERLAPWSLLPRVMVLTVLVVAVMTWLVAPQLTRLFKTWLYSPSTF